jgi:hypothetical protein
MPCRRRSLGFAVLLAVLRPTGEIALAQQPSTAARLGLEAYTMPTAVELGLVRPNEPKVEPAQREAGSGPEPTRGAIK